MTTTPLLLAVACSRGPANEPLTVLAASSLTDAFGELATTFEAAHPSTPVVLVLSGSHILTLQVEQGLQADVIATADPEHITRLVDAGLAQHPAPFASNHLALVTPADATVPASFAKLYQAERLVLALPQVPLGTYTDTLLAHGAQEHGSAWRAGVDAAIVSREPNARLVVAKVALGEADAAIAYATDVRPHRALRATPVPDVLGTRATYVHARLSDHPLAAAWTDWVVSADGQGILAEHGLGSAP